MISFIVVDYFKAARCSVNLEKVLCKGNGVEVILLDNSVNVENSKHYQALKKYSNFKYVDVGFNSGYTRACNAGVEHASGESIVFLNPDVEIIDVERFLLLVEEFLTSRNIVGFGQVNEDGSFPELIRKDPTFIELFVRKFVGRDRAISTVEFPCSVDWLQSSLIGITKELFISIGGFNEKYFLFMADIEICQNVRKCGGDVLFVPEIVAVADGVRASGGKLINSVTKKVFWFHVRDALYFFIRRG